MQRFRDHRLAGEQGAAADPAELSHRPLVRGVARIQRRDQPWGEYVPSKPNATRYTFSMDSRPMNLPPAGDGRTIRARLRPCAIA